MLTKLKNRYKNFKVLSNQRGLTLIELLAVLVIVAIVFAIFAFAMSYGQDKARNTGVTQGFKPYQIGFQGIMDENSGLVMATGSSFDYNTFNRYVEGKYSIATPSNGTGTTNPVNTSQFKDPWKTPFVIQAKYIADTKQMLVLRTKGKDKNSVSATDLYSVSTTGADKDDILLITEYENGETQSCTYGLEKNVGEPDMTGTGTLTVNGCK
jgi:prepilin-type N-terminal cleavage/methylation domain-containing protein